MAGADIVWGTARARWVLLTTILGSSIAMLDSTVVNVALPTLGEELDAPLSGLQWTVNAYALTLAALILVGGSLGDRLGRRRIFLFGIAWFAVASLLCGLSQDIWQLVAARALQGIGGALLTPGSLALIQASFVPADRARAIGTWAGLGGVATLIGPVVGGWLIDQVSWRWIFLINVPLAIVALVIGRRHVPESRDDRSAGHFDWWGAILAIVTLGAGTYALIYAADDLTRSDVLAAAVLALAGAVGFVMSQRREAHPMLPLGIFKSRQFSAANGMTFLVYAALSAVFFILVLQLQVVSGFSATAAGLSLVPVTVLMMFLSARAGLLAGKLGPRILMTVGPLICAVGVLLLLGVGPGADYVTDVLPGAVVFGLGLCALVAPLTATVLAAAEDRYAGVASGVNNAVARAAGLLAVAGLPLLVGLSTDVGLSPDGLDAAYDKAMIVNAVLLTAGGLLAWFTIRAPLAKTTEAVPAAPASRPEALEPVESAPSTAGVSPQATACAPYVSTRSRVG
ncbi:MAG: MFS transporter [Actinomycetota bacterium]|nr:MFS transporter [Actinomycetota bacterium]